MDITKVVNEGIYKTFIDFNKDEKNLKALIKYCQKLQPQQSSFVNASSLIKFYRLPIIIAFRALYEKYKRLPPQSITPEIKSILEDIAAWVNSLIQKLQIQIFQEIRFIFHWGRAKKKYNIQVSPPEIKFAKYIFELSKKRQKIKEKLKKEEDVQEETKDLQNLIIADQLNYFEENLVDFIKKNVVVEVNFHTFQAQKKIKSEQNQKNHIKKQQKLVVQQNKEIQVKSQSKYQIKMTQKANLKKDQLNRPFSEIKEKKPQLFEELPYEQEKKLPICCRTYFLFDQVIEQAENQMIEYKKYNYPFQHQPNQRPSKIQKIKKTLCGFLNNVGGTIYFGIKEHPDTKKRTIYGFELTQKYKSEFEDDIFDLLKDVIPDVQKSCVIKWVPIKNQHKNEFIPGNYIAKVNIQKGAKDQIYSYIHSGVEKFVFKTQNQFLVLNEPQKILKIFRNKMENAERPFYKLHEHPCRQPLKGKPIYKQEQISESILQQQFPSLPGVNSSYQILPEKKFKQKESNLYLIRGFSEQRIMSELTKRNLKYKFQAEIQPQQMMITLWDEKEIQELKDQGFQLQQIYSTIKYQITKQEASLISDIIHVIQQKYNCKIAKKQKDVLKFQNSKVAVRFWLKVSQIGLVGRFIPQQN